MRFLKLAIFLPATLMLFVQPSSAIDHSTIVNWNLCSYAEAGRRLNSDPSRDVGDLVTTILEVCQHQYRALIDPPAGKGLAREQVIESIKKTIDDHKALRESQRKAALIGDAIEQLAKLGVTEADFKDYFREDILEDERCSR